MVKGFQITKKSSPHVSFMPSLQLVKLLIKSGSITVEIVPEEQSRLIDDSHIRKLGNIVPNFFKSLKLHELERRHKTHMWTRFLRNLKTLNHAVEDFFYYRL